MKKHPYNGLFLTCVIFEDGTTSKLLYLPMNRANLDDYCFQEECYNSSWDLDVKDLVREVANRALESVGRPLVKEWGSHFFWSRDFKPYHDDIDERLGIRGNDTPENTVSYYRSHKIFLKEHK